MAEVHDLRPVGGAYELVPETDSEKGQVRFPDQVHLRLEYYSSVGFGQHEIGAGKNHNVRIFQQDGFVQTRCIVVQYLWLLTCTQCYVVKCLFGLFGFLVVVDYQNLQAKRSQGREELVYLLLGIVIMGRYAYSFDSTR